VVDEVDAVRPQLPNLRRRTASQRHQPQVVRRSPRAGLDRLAVVPPRARQAEGAAAVVEAKCCQRPLDPAVHHPAAVSRIGPATERSRREF
jgi:hypothetical protein